MDDPRFMHVTSDPRYQRMSKKRHKVTVDNRFKSMFTDQKFKINYAVDKRGKKMSESSQENLRRYYNLEEDMIKEDKFTESDFQKGLQDDDDDNDENQDGGQGGNHNEEEDDSGGGECAEGGLSDDGLGDGGDSGLSDDDSDGSSTDLDYDALSREDEIVNDWGDLTADVTRSHDTSHRLAVCNMNWDRITAQDLYVLFNSFKPQNGLVDSVKIYTSDYGKERLSKEEVEGPAELIDNGSTIVKDDQDNPDITEGQEFAREKLRQYQLNRLKYYYAIITCNDEVTAEHIYDECDGMEYENSASTIDIRFVPSDTEFNDKPCAIATDNSVASDFVPSNFFTSALQLTRVNLTWDETDPSRLKKTMKSFSKEELENIDFGAYLASSSDEEDLVPAQKNDSSAYRALLGINENGDEQEVNINDEDTEELQITWSIGLKDKKKKKEKVKSDKKTNKEQEEKEESDLGFDDPFFTTSVSTGKKKRKKNKLTSKEQQQIEKEKDELELLMMSDDDEDAGKKHFSLKDITTEDHKEGGKRKRKKRKFKEDKTETNDDNFTVDTGDLRFSALYESHLYAVDPTNPQYKQTKGMKEILSEKQKRSKIKRSKVSEEESNVDHGLGLLVKSVKAKALGYMEKKKKKKQSLLF